MEREGRHSERFVKGDDRTQWSKTTIDPTSDHTSVRIVCLCSKAKCPISLTNPGCAILNLQQKDECNLVSTFQLHHSATEPKPSTTTSGHEYPYIPRTVELGVYSSRGKGRFHKTRLLTIAPTCIVVNNLTHTTILLKTEEVGEVDTVCRSNLCTSLLTQLTSLFCWRIITMLHLWRR